MISATCIGNLGADAETKTLPSGKIVTNFRIACRGRDKDQTTWVRAALWGPRGQSLSQYLTKGSRIAVSGTLYTRDHDGKTYVELDASDVELLGDKRERVADEVPF